MFSSKRLSLIDLANCPERTSLWARVATFYEFPDILIGGTGRRQECRRGRQECVKSQDILYTRSQDILYTWGAGFAVLNEGFLCGLNVNDGSRAKGSVPSKSSEGSASASTVVDADLALRGCKSRAGSCSRRSRPSRQQLRQNGAESARARRFWRGEANPCRRAPFWHPYRGRAA